MDMVNGADTAMRDGAFNPEEMLWDPFGWTNVIRKPVNLNQATSAFSQPQARQGYFGIGSGTTIQVPSLQV